MKIMLYIDGWEKIIQHPYFPPDGRIEMGFFPPISTPIEGIATEQGVRASFFYCGKKRRGYYVFEYGK